MTEHRRLTDALLVLEDGRAFRGTAYGAEGETFGEMVFNTGMTGYQETLTDPSYHRQIVAMTAPHIGNTGVNDEDPESGRVQVAGYVVREPARVVSSWRARRSLDDELSAHGVVGIADPGHPGAHPAPARPGRHARPASAPTETEPGRCSWTGSWPAPTWSAPTWPAWSPRRALRRPARGRGPLTGWPPSTSASRR